MTMDEHEDCDRQLNEAEDKIIEQTERIKELEAELEKHRWIPTSERLPEKKDNSFCSAWVVAMDKKTWTIAQYNYEYAHWDKDHSPYDLGMEVITHWKPIMSKP